MRSIALFLRLKLICVVMLCTMLAVAAMDKALAEGPKDGDELSVIMWCDVDSWDKTESRVREAMAEPGIALWQKLVNEGIGCYDARAFGYRAASSLFHKFRPDIQDIEFDSGQMACVVELKGSDPSHPHILSWSSKLCPPEA